MFTSFINYLSYEKRYSPHTVVSYSNDIKQFSDFLLSTYDVEKVEIAGYQHIRGWIVEMIQNGLNPRSVNRKISALKTYFNFLKRQGVIEENPTVKIVSPKTESRLPQYIQEEEMALLLDEIIFEENFSGVRDRLILDILYQTGIRRAELINMVDTDIDYSRQVIKVMGKGKKERLIPVATAFCQSVSKYIEVRNNNFERVIFPGLFVSDKGNKMYPKLVYNIVNRYLSLVSTIDKRSPHILRHSFATHMSNRGAKLNAIKELMGHANLSATQIYTHNSIEQLKKVYLKAHPKAK